MRLIDADALVFYYGGLEKIPPWDCRGIAEYFANQVRLAPTIVPAQQWIPVSEGLPDEKDAGILKKLGTNKRSEYVLATVEVKGERMTVTACTYDGEWDWNMKYAFPDYKIVAWMPLPEPWKGEEE